MKEFFGSQPLRYDVWANQKVEVAWRNCIETSWKKRIQQRHDGQTKNFEHKKCNIPKVMHFVWLGPRSPPFLFDSPGDTEKHGITCALKRAVDVYGSGDQATSRRRRAFSPNGPMQSWMETYTPEEGWEHVLWTDEDIIALNLLTNGMDKYKESHENEDYPEKYHQALIKPTTNRSVDYGRLSDIVRYEILHRYGGMYLDVDYLCWRNSNWNLNHLLTSGCTFLCGASNAGCVELNNGIVACTPRHPLLQLVIQEVKRGLHGLEQDHKNANEGEQSKAPQNEKEELMHQIASFLPPSKTNSDQKAKEAHNSLLSFMLAPSQTQKGYKQRAMETIRTTGPGMLTRVVCSYVLSCEPVGEHVHDESDSSSIVIVPAHVFHPLPNTVRLIRTEGKLQCEEDGKPQQITTKKQGKERLDVRYCSRQEIEDVCRPYTAPTLSTSRDNSGSLWGEETIGVHLWAQSWQLGSR